MVKMSLALINADPARPGQLHAPSSTNSTNFQAVPKDPSLGSSRPGSRVRPSIRPDRAWVLGVAVCAVIRVLQ